MKRVLKYSTLAVLILLSSLIFAACSGAKADNSSTDANAETEIVEVSTALAKVAEIPTYFEATGSLASDAQSDVAPNISGKIVSVNFDIGNYVQRGDVLVRLDARDAQIKPEQAQAQVQQQRKVVEQAEAGVNQAIANLRQTQARLNVKDGAANERLVQTGLLENDIIEIKQNVQENVVVATSNIDKLGDGLIVNQVK